MVELFIFIKQSLKWPSTYKTNLNCTLRVSVCVRVILRSPLCRILNFNKQKQKKKKVKTYTVFMSGCKFNFYIEYCKTPTNRIKTLYVIITPSFKCSLSNLPSLLPHWSSAVGRRPWESPVTELQCHGSVGICVQLPRILPCVASVGFGRRHCPWVVCYDWSLSTYS